MARPGEVHYCQWENCARRSYNTLADLKRHLSELHKGRQPRYACPVVGCTQHCDRRLEMTPHIKLKHGLIALSLAKANIARSGELMNYGSIRIKAGWEMLARSRRDAWEVLDDGTGSTTNGGEGTGQNSVATTAADSPETPFPSDDYEGETSGEDGYEDDQPGPSGTVQAFAGGI